MTKQTTHPNHNFYSTGIHWAGIVLCCILGFVFSQTTAAKPEVDPALRETLKATISQADSFEDRFDAEVWLVQKSGVLQRFIKDPEERLHILKEIHKASTRAQLPPEYVLAVIHVESAFDQFAISQVGAQGMMQIMPFWKKEIGRDNDNLMDIPTNLKYGCTILKYYLEVAKGDWREALARYNGSYGKHKYPNKVIVAWQRYWK
ncbi:lytic transglycosylase domain-containing protein [Teredinibacter sp. KSP-S5-2]|uniref:lytic transglycosylase domain-containing protein n=1 Tax=Teredinibacter sp. KSP-S5-2 TaxID=3034506 RepID=UPI0029348CE7|nr:lytic transglycosylase domain-containing protein [Teredinibacter sp. KSP-S5-2]WNO09675.1 lytic transglycosylase domain-containing protein [Teredinibacter sp. KSP-S5-2]